MLPNISENRAMDLWRKYKIEKDIQAREKLINEYVSLVKYVSGRMAMSLPPTIQQDDLFSYGIFGLLDAIEKFELDRNIKFETYAIVRIRGSILDGLRAMDWVPYSVRHKAKELEKVYNDLDVKLGRPATDEEVCQAMGIDSAQYNRLLSETSVTSMISLNDLWNVESDGTTGNEIIDHIEDKNAEDPIEMLALAERKGILAEAIGKLPDREKMVISLYYYDGLTLKEIGKVLEVSESRVSQLHTKAVLRLRGRLSRVKQKLFD